MRFATCTRQSARAALGATLLVTALTGCAGSVPTGGGSGGGGTGAGGSGAGAAGPSQTITGNWQLVSGEDSQGRIVPGSAVVTFTVNGASSGGRGPCNSFGAKVTGTTSGTISIVMGIQTEMACADPDGNTTETRYFAALGAVTSASVENRTLTLSGRGDSLVFTPATK